MRTRLCCTACITVLALLFAGCAQDVPQRVTADFNTGWLFELGEQDVARVTAPEFDDSGWEAVRLPHDWAIAGPFDPEANGSTGKLPWRGVGWYRKTFTLAAADEGRRVYFDFDGVMAFPKVYVNGELAGEWDYGYNSFRVDATPYVNFGGENVIAVQADTREHRSRWYPGAGIYRKVTMTIANPVHIAHWGTFITTPSVNDDAATVQVVTTVENHLDESRTVDIATELIDPDGAQVGDIRSSLTIPAGESRDLEQALVVENPQRWDIDSPELYTAVSVVEMDGRRVDTGTNTFGIRTFEFTADDGFHLNGRRVQLYGVNLHHDQGPLGAAFNVRAMERQLEIMQDMGVNALRTSHNVPAPEVLDLCDRMGIVVWDEAFDKWDDTADHIGDEPLETFGERQIKNFVMRDRNHPSIVLWSIANEIPTENPDRQRPGRIRWEKNAERVAFMRDFVLEYDPTRPVTLGNHIPADGDSDVLDTLDVVGWNYDRRYARFRETHPDMPLIYSESASTLSTRGFYDLPLPESKTDYNREALQVSSYDLNAAAWSDIPDREFLLMEEDAFVAGEFVWTGIDYLGEPTPFTRQARSSYFGIVDLAGIPKDRFYLYRSYWRPDETTIHILPHWNWPEREGGTVPVFVYTNGDSAELFLNGRSLGMREKIDDVPGGWEGEYYASIDRYRLRWMEVPYEPGVLRVVAYKNGEEIGETAIQTAGDPARLALTPDRTVIAADGYDLSYVLVEAADTDGVLCPLADDMVSFEVDGPAEIAGIGNGDPLSLEPFQDAEHSLFYGKAVVILRSTGGTGAATLTASADGYAAAQVEIGIR